MTSEPDLLRKLSGINQSAAFNRWAGFEVCRAVVGGADVRMERRPEHGQYSDFLHVGLVAALIDTCCGFAAATLFDHVLATHFSIDCLSPALGHSSLAKGLMVKHVERLLRADNRTTASVRRIVPGLLHFSTFNWFLGGLALIAAAIWCEQDARLATGLFVGSSYLYGALGNLWATRGRHVGW